MFLFLFCTVYVCVCVCVCSAAAARRRPSRRAGCRPPPSPSSASCPPSLYRSAHISSKECPSTSQRLKTSNWKRYGPWISWSAVWLLVTKKGLKSQPFLGRKIAFVVSYNLRRLTRLVIAVVAVYGICIVTSADSDGRLLVFCLLSTQCCSSLRKRWVRTEWPRGTTLPSPRSSTKSAHPVGEEPARQLSSCCLLRLVWWVEMLQTRAVTIKLYLSKKWGWIFMILTVFIYLIAYVRTRLKWE